MESEPQPPLVKVAFDDPGTRKAWERTRRRVRSRLALWCALLLAAVVVGGVLAPSQPSSSVRGDSGLGGAIGGIAFLILPFTLFACCGALARLRRAREVLEAYPWQSLRGVRRLSGPRESTGVAVQFRLPDAPATDANDAAGGPDASEARENRYMDEDGTWWSQSLSARDPLRWNRWDAGLEQGAWFAGDLERGGVLALPGPRGLMTVQRRSQVLTMERRTARAEHESIVAAGPGRRD